MKLKKFLITQLYILLLLPLAVFAQPDNFQTKKVTENGYTYETVTNDPLKARVYTLENGLKVYMTVYKNAPRLQTYIAVRAGSKNDPAHATGLAHYLEHILFKGTTQFGTSDWTKEKAELEKIESLYEVYRNTKEAREREKIYHKIDSISLVAAGYAIANEYDKMLSNIGASGTNAYTFLEQTVYVNDIPSNQIEKWAEIEAERFSTVVPRLFHTELEAVYEEKNKGLDNDRKKVWEAMLAGLFQKHPYGTQTTIGTVEHLKNPSITEIKKYFDKYYVPNNMAICLSGDFDPAQTIQQVDKYFGKLQPKEIEPFIPVKEDPIVKPIEQNVYGPDAENISIAFRTEGRRFYSERDSAFLLNDGPFYQKVISMLLTNGQAGLIDLNLMQKQKVLSAYSYEMSFNDYSGFVLGGRPLQGQSLEELKGLLLGQLEEIKKGNFDDWLLQAVINDYKMSKMKEYESNRSRADAFVDAFISNLDWEDYISEIERLESMTKEQIVKFANENFKDNYVVVYKRNGSDTTIQKVPKPKITQVPVNRNKQSDFYQSVMSKPSESIQPVFLDFEKDMTRFSTKNKLPVHYIQNTENELFQLYFAWDTGKDTNPKLALAVGYLDFLGTADKSAEEIKKEFYKLGCSYSVSVKDDQVYFSLSGLQENMEPALKLFENLLSNAKADPAVYQDMVQRILKARADNKLSKDVILRSAMVNYAKHGPQNPFTNIISEEQLKALDPSELTRVLKDLRNYKHKVLYYGPASKEALNKAVTAYHKVPASLKDLPEEKRFDFKETNKNIVYYVDYDMVQAEIMFLSKSVPYDKTLAPQIYLFNEYFGGSMGSLVFQEMRESKALAYAVKSYYAQAGKKEDPNYIVSYIGTQADKLQEAVEGLQDLIDNMPESQALFENAKASGIETISSQRITKAGILFEYERIKKLGLESDMRKEAYQKIKDMTFEDIKKFQQSYLKEKPRVMLVIGSKDRIDFEALSKYGKVKELKLEEIFGY